MLLLLRFALSILLDFFSGCLLDIFAKRNIIRAAWMQILSGIMYRSLVTRITIDFVDTLYVFGCLNWGKIACGSLDTSVSRLIKDKNFGTEGVPRASNSLVQGTTLNTWTVRLYVVVVTLVESILIVLDRLFMPTHQHIVWLLFSHMELSIY